MLVTISGFMCSGKSYLGRRLADKLKFAFIDLDEYLETEILHKSIAQTFKENGESYFRDLEAYAFRQLIMQCKKEDIVIALGGGTIMNQDNRTLIDKYTTNIFINTPIEIIIPRAMQSAELEKRPLLKQVPFNELARKIVELYENRRPTYMAHAQYIVENTVDISVCKLVNNMANFINQKRYA